MQAQVQVAERSRGQALADELHRRWSGRRTDDQTDTVIDAVHLASSPTAWPPLLRIDFTMDGRHGVWDVRWGSPYLDRGPIADAADWFAQIAWEAFPEVHITGYVPEGLRFLDE